MNHLNQPLIFRGFCCGFREDILCTVPRKTHDDRRLVRIVIFVFTLLIYSATRGRPTETTNVNWFGIGTPSYDVKGGHSRHSVSQNLQLLKVKLGRLPTCSQWLWNYVPVWFGGAFFFKRVVYPDATWTSQTSSKRFEVLQLLQDWDCEFFGRPKHP